VVFGIEIGKQAYYFLQRVLGCMLILILNLPLDGTKGELFIIKAPELNLDVIVNTSVFILPLGGDLFKVGLLTIGKIKRT
jgi:hypothetical protein